MKVACLILGLLTLSQARRVPTAKSKEHVLEKRQTSTTANYPAHYFSQTIDHFPNSTRYAPHTNQTFQQRYYFDASYYKPGGPVFLYIGGETSGPSRFEFMQRGIIKILMEATNGLGIILENRYYGESYPFSNSSTDNLRFLTTEQTIADNANFARYAKFPGVSSNVSLNAPHSPWILYGGSLAGAQTAFSLNQYGGDYGLLWGGIAASGTTKAVLEYPQWYNPIIKYGPQDCVASIIAIVDNINLVFDSGNQTLINQMKAIFGMEGLYDADFAQAIAFPMGGPMNYPTCTWQELNWDPLDDCPDFFSFCSNVTNLNAPESIRQVDYELSEITNDQSWTNLGNYAYYVKTQVNPYCQGLPLNHTPVGDNYCFGTQNESYYADVTNSGTRSYLYSTCIEGGLYQVAPSSGPSLVANVLNVNYTQQWCRWAFPPGKYSSIPDTPDLARINKYGGYSVTQDRLAHVDGEQDVWLDVCYHSNLVSQRYSLNATDAYLNPQQLITGSGHHWDSYGQGGLAQVSEAPLFIQAAQRWEINIVQKWLEEWQQLHG